jgi:hypothetical protein
MIGERYFYPTSSSNAKKIGSYDDRAVCKFWTSWQIVRKYVNFMPLEATLTYFLVFFNK